MKRNTQERVLISYVVMVAILMAIPACRTTVVYGPDHCPVVVSADGAVEVDGKSCRMEDIPKRLKSAGFQTDTMIHVSVPDNVKPETLSSLSSALASGGYSRFFFVKPLQKESFTKDADGKASQTPRKQPAPK